MAISFLQVPTGVKVPGTYVEFDTSKAQQGVSIQNHRVLLIGQRLSTGSKAAGSIDQITSESQARDYYGPGSMLYHMCKAFIGANGGLNELRAIALDDDGGAVKATGSFEITAAPTAAGTLAFYLGGRAYKVAVVSTDSEADVIAALVAEITADDDRHADVAIDGGNADLMTITARHGGEVGNDLDVRLNYFGEETPEGITSTITAMSSGTTNPGVSSVITAMGETQYNEIAHPYSDTANLLLLTTELDDRWGPIRQNDGHMFYCRKESFAAHSTFLDGRNNGQETVMNIAGPTPTFEWAANLAAEIAGAAQSDPALPFESLALTQVLKPADTELFDHGERDLLLKGGSSTYTVDGGGVVRIERMRTTRVENEFSAPDEALADLNPKLTLSYLRYDFRANWVTKFSRFKIADDGTRFGAGQRIITPKIGKAECIARFRLWEELGLVEGLDQFKRDLIVERSSSDVNRMDILLPPDLVNQLRVTGVQIGFFL